MIKLLANPYALIGAGLLFLLAVGGAYFQGRSDGKAQRDAASLKLMQKATVALNKARDAIDVVSGQHAAASAAQSTETREIYHESVQIIDRPVFRTVCGDADAVRLLDRAAANSNRGLTGISAQPTAGASADAP